MTDPSQYPQRILDPPPELVREVLAALRAVCRGDIAEIKIVHTRRGIDVLRTQKRRYTNP